MKTLLPKAALWIPFLFVVFLSALSIGSSFLGARSRPVPDLTVFLCFVPMAFFFVALTTQRYVSLLERRLDDLERRVGAKNV